MNYLKLDNFDAVIFDMDGILIDSEPLWKIVMESVFESVGFNITRKDFEKTVGLRIDEVVHFWFNEKPFHHASQQEVIDKIMDGMVDIIQTKGIEIAGVTEFILFLKSQNKKIGIATSSYQVLLDATVNRLKIEALVDAKSSAEFEDYGKPHPAVYLKTAQKLGIPANKCLVIEDSFNGIISGIAAGMTVICIPEPTHTPNARLSVANFQFEQMTDLHQFLRMQNE